MEASLQQALESLEGLLLELQTPDNARIEAGEAVLRQLQRHVPGHLLLQLLDVAGRSSSSLEAKHMAVVVARRSIEAYKALEQPLQRHIRETLLALAAQPADPCLVEPLLMLIK